MCVTSSNGGLKFIAYLLQCIDAFIGELRWEESDLTKRDKMCKQKLISEEWARVTIFLGLLIVCLPLHLQNTT